MVRHFGVFKFKKAVTDEQIADCFGAMKSMVGQIPGLLHMEHGPYDSTEGLNDGFTHGFIMTFDTLASRDNYLPHSMHEKIKSLVLPNLERVMVFDFNISESTDHF